MPRMTLYRRSMGACGVGDPRSVEKNLIAEMWAEMFL